MSQSVNDGGSARQLFNAPAPGLAAVDIVPRLDWSLMRETDHFVQFYDADSFLLDSLCDYVAAGLAEGDACVLIMTGAHRDGLEGRMRARGLDLDGARDAGLYVPLDAWETLSKFTVEGEPEPRLFAEVIGPIVEGAAAGGRRVRLFGEMVAMLWEQGRGEAALRLEGFWNGLRAQREFRLLCAYPMKCFGDGSEAGPLALVCQEHSHSIPAESYTALAGPEERLRAVIELQRKAARLEAEVAEREQALRREQKAREEAEAASRLKDEFLATVSHELRTPLTAIMGWAGILRGAGLDGPDAERALETIERNARWQAQLVEDILDVSRIIRGKLRLEVAPVDLFTVVGAAVDSLRPAAEAKRIRVEVSLDPSARRVAGDACRLQQVVWNLLSNAVKFTDEGGRVGVRVGRADACVLVTVTDTGCGIGAEFLPHVFERFRQADGTTTRRHGGLGLGLAIVRHLVELHGGEVSAESEGEGSGATFRVTLPAAAPGPNQTPLS